MPYSRDCDPIRNSLDRIRNLTENQEPDFEQSATLQSRAENEAASRLDKEREEERQRKLRSAQIGKKGYWRKEDDSESWMSQMQTDMENDAIAKDRRDEERDRQKLLTRTQAAMQKAKKPPRP